MTPEVSYDQQRNAHGGTGDYIAGMLEAIEKNKQASRPQPAKFIGALAMPEVVVA